MVFVFIFLAGIVSSALSYVLRVYGLKHLLDIPNLRSSHQLPTPRGGGLAIVISFYLMLFAFLANELLQQQVLIVLLSGIGVAAIGFWDDHRSLSARWRFTVHVFCAMSALLLMPSLPILDFGLVQVTSAWLVFLPVLLFQVWCLNLFNFMDGIDGIAGSETVFVFTVLAILIYPFDSLLAFISLGLSVSTLGFLLWNWPPAKIFMGDVGSGFLGFMIALIILLCAREAPVFLPIGLILFAVFICDASYTLLYRIWNGQKWYQAHCSHAYQHAARKKGHKFVVLAILLINLFWLLPLSIVVYNNVQYALPALAAAYLPLLALVVKMKAGVPVT